MLQNPIIVLGSHRSGTSAVAGILHHLGVYMGDNFQEPNDANPKGYWEDPEFSEVNEHIYDSLKGSPHESRPLPPGALNDRNKSLNHWYYLMEKRNKDHCVWGFKDPKFSLIAKHVMKCVSTWPVEGPRFLSECCTIIRTHREVDDTVFSLVRALGFHCKDTNIDMWRAYVNRYIAEINSFCEIYDGPILNLDYSMIRNNPKEMIDDICEFITGPCCDTHVFSPDYLQIERARKFMDCSDFIYTDP